MRFQRKQNKLKADAIAKLYQANFVWEAPHGPEKEKMIEWGKHFCWAVNFHKAEGHCNIPKELNGKAVPAAIGVPNNVVSIWTVNWERTRFNSSRKLDLTFTAFRTNLPDHRYVYIL